MPEISKMSIYGCSQQISRNARFARFEGAKGRKRVKITVVVIAFTEKFEALKIDSKTYFFEKGSISALHGIFDDRNQQNVQ